MTTPEPSRAQMTQAQANQVAGAFWAAAMVTNVGMRLVLGLVLPGVPWSVLTVSGLLAAPASMALLTVVMPVRPQWVAALKSIRLRGSDRGV